MTADSESARTAHELIAAHATYLVDRQFRGASAAGQKSKRVIPLRGLSPRPQRLQQEE